MTIHKDFIHEIKEYFPCHSSEYTGKRGIPDLYFKMDEDRFPFRKEEIVVGEAKILGSNTGASFSQDRDSIINGVKQILSYSGNSENHSLLCIKIDVMRCTNIDQLDCDIQLIKTAQEFLSNLGLHLLVQTGEGQYDFLRPQKRHLMQDFIEDCSRIAKECRIEFNQEVET